MPEKSSEAQISFLEVLDREPEPEAPPVTESKAEPKVWSVTELARNLRDQLRTHYSRILVKGEICDFKGIHRSGHLYMGLKDENSQIRVVVWKGVVQKIPFDLKMGLEVIVSGSIDFYGAGGSLQVVAEAIEPLGIGSLQLKFEQLKEKLQKEGLFEASRKKALPSFPQRIGLVTGKSTAALQDMLKIFAQRYPLVELFLFQASVQGEQAPRELCAAIKRAEVYSQKNQKLDLLIIARGGGSYEDLFCFNDEQLARAIAGSPLPTLSAVGHEIDFTICDFVADHRSATPSHAAQESTPDVRFIRTQLQNAFEYFKRNALTRLSDLVQRVDSLWNQLLSKAPHNRLRAQAQVLDQLSARLQRGVEVRLAQLKAELQRYASFLEALSPLKIFERGYSLVQTANGEVVRSSDKIQTGDLLTIRLHEGTLTTEVKQKSR